MNKDKRNSIVWFTGLTFFISWGVWVPLAVLNVATPFSRIGTFGPVLAALLLTAFRGGKGEVKKLLKKLLIWRVRIGWYVFSFLSTAIIVLGAIGLHVWLGGALPEFEDLGQIYLVIPIFLFVLVFSTLGEEIGWRGYALPRLQARYGALTSSLILGIIWGLWHLPLFWMKGDFHQDIPIGLFMLQILGFSILYTWLFNNTRGSLLIAHLFHAASNTTLGVIPILPMDTGGIMRPLWLAVGLLWVFALAVVAYFGPEDLSREHSRLEISVYL